MSFLMIHDTPCPSTDTLTLSPLWHPDIAEVDKVKQSAPLFSVVDLRRHGRSRVRVTQCG